MTSAVLLRRGAGDASTARPYRVADVTMLADFASPLLAPFLAGSPAGVTPSPEESGGHACGSKAMLFDGIVELGGASRRVRCVGIGGTQAGYEIEIGLDPSTARIDASTPDAPRTASPQRTLLARVAATGARVEYELPDPPPPELAELLLGAPLLLALALRGTFCLHASAVLLSQGAVLFLGESGAGKSTLARELAAQGVRRIADDMLLARAAAKAGEPPKALPRFPQPRLASEQQPAAAPREAPIAAIYLLGGPADTVERRRATAAEATLALARHTVAARLFAPDLLANHLTFTSSLARAAPVLHLRYPWRAGGVDAVADTIREDLRSTTLATRRSHEP